MESEKENIILNYVRIYGQFYEFFHVFLHIGT